MSISDALRLASLEASLAELLSRVAVLEASERPSSAPTGDAVPVHGRDRRPEAAKPKTNNVKAPAGNSPIYALRRLERDHPELAQKVLAGELSAHAAAIAAGFRRRMISVPADPNAVSAYNRRAKIEAL